MSQHRRHQQVDRFNSSERGSAMLMGVLLLWMIVYAISLVGHVSTLVSNKMKAQMAADTAALSAARLLANNMSTMAWVNDSRALLYYTQVKYGADLISSGTLALMKATRPQLSDGTLGDAISDQELWGRSGFVSAFTDSFDNLTELRHAPWEENNSDYWDEVTHGTSRQVKGRSAEEHLARFQHHLAQITEVMLEKEIYDRASANGAELSSYFPSASIYPEPGSERELFIESIDRVEDDEGDLVSVSGWKFWNEDLDIEATAFGDRGWDIDAHTEGSHIQASIRRGEPSENWTTVTLQIDDGQPEIMYIDTVNNVIITDTVEISMNFFDDGSTEVIREENGSVSRVRYRVVDGVLEIYDYGSRTFAPVVAEEESESTEVNGTQVRIENFNHIDFGVGQLYQDFIRFGSFTVHFSNPVRIVSHLYGFSIRAENDETRVNGLSTRNANCQWESPRWYDRSNHGDTTRHRMCEEIPGVQWRYEFVEDPSYLTEESIVTDTTLPDRFVERGEVLSRGQVLETRGWEDMLDTRSGRTTYLTDSGNAYVQRRTCWHPEDLNCLHDHAQDLSERLECTPTVGQPNGMYHHRSNGAEVLCRLCGGDGVVEIGVQDLNNLSSSDIDLLLDDASASQFSEISALTDRLQHYPIILESIERRPETSSDLPPLVLREDFFKYGITVGTWIGAASSEEEEVGDLGAGLQRAFEGGEGVFAYASARAGFRDPSTGELRFSFVDGALSEESLAWVAGRENLYLADWEAALVPLKTQINSLDLDAEEDDTGLTYLLRRLRANAWRADFLGPVQSNPIPRNMADFNDPLWVELIQH